MNVYPVKIEWKGKNVTASLKLDLRHIRELQETTGKDILDLISDAPVTFTAMGDLLEAALHWKGNEPKFILLGTSVVLLAVLQLAAIPAIILLFIIMSVILYFLGRKEDVK